MANENYSLFLREDGLLETGCVRSGRSLHRPWLGVGSDLPSYAICPSDKPYLEGGFGDS